MDPLWRDLIQAVTTIRADSANEANALAFLRDNTSRFAMPRPDVRPPVVAGEVAGLARKLRLWGRDANAAALEGALAHLVAGDGEHAHLYVRCLLDLSGRPLSVPPPPPPPPPSAAGSASVGAALGGGGSTLPDAELAAALGDWRDEFDAGSDSDGGGSDSTEEAPPPVPARAGRAAPRDGVAAATASSAVPWDAAAPPAPAPAGVVCAPSPTPPPLPPASVFTLLEAPSDPMAPPRAASAPAPTGAPLHHAVRVADEAVFVGGALAALQGHTPGLLGAQPGGHAFVVAPPAASTGGTGWGSALHPVAPPFAQLLGALAPPSSAHVGAGGAASVYALARSRGGLFAPTVLLDDADGGPPLGAPGVAPGCLRAVLAPVLDAADCLRWVDWVSEWVISSGDAPLALGHALGGGGAGGSGGCAASPAVVRFGRTATQLARALRGVVDDVRLDAGCLLAAHRDALAQAQQQQQQWEDGGPRAGADGDGHTADAASLLRGLESGGADERDASGDAAHPALTLTVVSAWVRRYQPLVRLLVELTARCFLSAPTCADGGDVLAAAGVDALSCLPPGSPAAATAGALHALTDAVFPAWSAAACLDALCDTLQRELLLARPGSV